MWWTGAGGVRSRLAPAVADGWLRVRIQVATSSRLESSVKATAGAEYPSMDGHGVAHEPRGGPKAPHPEKKNNTKGSGPGHAAPSPGPWPAWRGGVQCALG